MKKFTILITALIFALHISPVFAQDINFGIAKIDPSSPVYFLKGVREVLELKFAATTNVKAHRQLEFAIRRIREVNSLAKTSHQDLIAPTLDRYLSHLQELINIVNVGDEGLISQIHSEITLHTNALQTIYSQVLDPQSRRSIRATIFRLAEWDQQLIDKLNSSKRFHLAQDFTISKLIGCNFLSKIASDSALNEIEREVFSKRAQTCLTPKP